jgi:hypothetical protein
MLVASTEQVASFFRGNEYRKYIKNRGKVKSIICHPRQRICFLLTTDKTIVKTQVQAFALQAVEVPGNLWERRLHRVRGLIQERKIKSYNELIEECGKGVILVPISLGWYA